MLKKTIKIVLLFLIFVCAAAQGQLTPDQTAFNAGEVSPLLHGRIDFQKYNNGCKILENMLVTAQGPDVRRPGTKYIAQVKDSNDVTRLLPFEYAKTDTYILEFGDLYMRVYRNGAQLADPIDGNEVYEITTPFDTEEIDDLQYVQSADVMYLVDGNDIPQRLSRTGHTSWTIVPIDFNDGPFQDENINDYYINISDVNIGNVDVNDWATGLVYPLNHYVLENYVLYKCISAHTSGASTRPYYGADWHGKWKDVAIPAESVVQLTCTTNIFAATDVNSLWQVTHKRAATQLSGAFTSATTSDTILCGSMYTATSHGRWTGVLRLERSIDAGVTWNLVEPRSSENDDNMLRSDTETEDDVLYRFNMSTYTSGSCTYDFVVHDYDHSGNVWVTDYIDPCNVVGEVRTSIVRTSQTKYWNKPYWSDTLGWPRTVEFHEERLFFGGSTSFPQTIWSSVTSDYENMKIGDTDKDALIYILPGQNPVQWLLSQNYLMIGTAGGAGKLGGSSADEPITGTSISYNSQSNRGSASIRAVVAGDAVLYAERNGRRIREFIYDFGRDKFVSPDLTILSSHILEDGVTNFAYQNNPNPVLWCVLNDGNCAAMCYERDNEVIGWSRIITDGSFEDVAVISGTGEDEVWFIVNRTIDGITRRYIEQLQPYDWGNSQSDCFFVDSGLSWDGGDAVNISAISKADPAVVTVSIWPADDDGTALADGDQVKILNVRGMTQVNSNIYSVSNPDTDANTFELRNSADSADINSVDYSTYTSGGTVQRVEKTFTNLDHLEGETCAVLSDRGVLSNVVVTDGSVTVSQWSNKVHIGLPYTSVLQTLSLPLKTQMGSLALNQKRMIDVGVDFYKTAGAEYGTGSDNLEEIDFSNVYDEPNEAVPLFTGRKIMNVQAGWSDELTVYIRQQYALPLTVRSVTMKVDVAK